MKSEYVPEVGTVVRLDFGPFKATGVVVEVIEAGARIKVNDDARLVGWKHEAIVAPNGTVLEDRPDHTFCGRAHFHTLQRVEEKQ